MTNLGKAKGPGQFFTESEVRARGREYLKRLRARNDGQSHHDMKDPAVVAETVQPNEDLGFNKVGTDTAAPESTSVSVTSDSDPRIQKTVSQPLGIMATVMRIKAARQQRS